MAFLQSVTGSGPVLTVPGRKRQPPQWTYPVQRGGCLLSHGWWGLNLRVSRVGNPVALQRRSSLRGVDAALRTRYDIETAPRSSEVDQLNTSSPVAASRLKNWRKSPGAVPNLHKTLVLEFR